jgi:hypothetical protein
MDRLSKRKPRKEDEVVKAKRTVARKTKAKLQPKNTTRINKIKTPSQSKGQKMNNKDLMDAQKSGFIKIDKKATLNEVTGKSTRMQYTVTPKGKKYIKDTAKAYTKDPMKLKPKLVSEKTWQEKLSKKKI